MPSADPSVLVDRQDGSPVEEDKIDTNLRAKFDIETDTENCNSELLNPCNDKSNSIEF